MWETKFHTLYEITSKIIVFYILSFVFREEVEVKRFWTEF
jgi:hypothetical protein